jgi:hypothetical protein
MNKSNYKLFKFDTIVFEILERDKNVIVIVIVIVKMPTNNSQALKFKTLYFDNILMNFAIF